MKIAWIGTGIMGKNMLQRLANANHLLHIYNRTLSKMDQLNHINIKKFNSIKEAIAGVDLIMTMVGYPQDVLDVYCDKEKGILEFANSHQICIDFTTSSPQIAKQIAYNDKNIAVLDAPVTGGDIGAQNGTLSILVGGNFATFEKVKPILEVLGNKINYFGQAGSGQHAKMFNQILVGINTYNIAEALNHCIKNEVNLEGALSIFKKSIGNSWQLENNGPKMIDNNLMPGFLIKHLIKDLNLVKENQKTYLYAINEVLKVYQEFANENQSVNNLGTQAIFEYIKLKREQ
ncbi:MAG: NAD(P)-dependent oxidoreductase [Malacoplasma sp.]|nr:NAD(P)-dependent oxidoreductase [Malacoplasma sp.]